MRIEQLAVIQECRLTAHALPGAPRFWCCVSEP